MIKVSVVMPVYNEEAYIKEALESFIKQSLDEKELICIDDGSTDYSINIIQDYIAKYKNIKLLKQSRKGAGAARNLGMKNAVGEYLCFLDADDFYIASTSLQKLYEEAEKNKMNVCAGLLQVISENKTDKNKVLRNLLKGNDKIIVKYVDFQFDYQYQCYIFKRKFLEQYDIYFPLYKRFQDPPFLVQALYYAEEFCVVAVEFYGYRLGYKNIVYTKEKTNDLFLGLMFNLKFARKHNLEKLFKLTISRINQEYFDILYRGLNIENTELLELMLKADSVTREVGYRIEPLEALLFLNREGSYLTYKEYHLVRKLHGLIPQAKRVILYGAGNIGKQCQQCIENNNLFEDYLWVDQYKAGLTYMEKRIYNIEMIQNYEYDFLLLAIADDSVARSVEEQLILMGISKEKIIKWNRD